jgi:exonuclease SbcC
MAMALRDARKGLRALEDQRAAEQRRRAAAQAQLTTARQEQERLDARRARLDASAEEVASDPKREAVLAQAGAWAEELARVVRELARLESERLRASEDVQARGRLRDQAGTAAAEAERASAAAAEALATARESLDERKRTLAAHDLRAHLQSGAPCPVCEQAVAKPPARRKPAGLGEAESREAAAAAAAEKARGQLEAARLRRERLDGEERAAAALLAKTDERVSDARATRRRLAEALEGAGFLPLDVAEADALCRRIATDARAAAESREKRERLEAERRAIQGEATRVSAALASATAQFEASSVRVGEIDGERAPLAATAEQVQAELAAEAQARGWRLGDGRSADEQSTLEQLQAGLRALARESRGKVERLRAQSEALDRAIERAVEITARRQALESQSVLGAALAQHLRADQFLAFVQEEALLRLAEDGSRHLEALSQGRYSLLCEDQEFGVTDHWHADRKRSVRTLSGGETFLASLALALALAESLASMSAEGRAGDALESLFLDEGFGTLDPETLDVVVQAIEALHGGQRLVGVVTHISELAERLPARVEVGRSAAGATLTLR